MTPRHALVTARRRALYCAEQYERGRATRADLIRAIVATVAAVLGLPEVNE